MNENAKAMVLAAFIGDALSLGVHWVYNTNVIDKKYGRVIDMLAPRLASFHRGKVEGEFTHYGDQTLLLLESIASDNGFDLNRFAGEWRSFFEEYEGYIDGATKATQANFKAGKNADSAGSDSEDLGGAARIAPLVYLYQDDPNHLIQAVKTQTTMTHDGPEIAATAEFFARTVLAVFDGKAPRTAMEGVMEVYFNRSPFNKWVPQGLDSAATDSRTAIKNFGQMCEVEAAFPSTVHLVTRYQEDFEQALVENIMAGGDSAARGLVTGMILGTYHGIDAIPQRWLNDLKAYDRIVALLDRIDPGMP
jgi:ADP-ribosylglycohydrolase